LVAGHKQRTVGLSQRILLPKSTAISTVRNNTILRYVVFNYTSNCASLYQNFSNSILKSNEVSMVYRNITSWQDPFLRN